MTKEDDVCDKMVLDTVCGFYKRFYLWFQDSLIFHVFDYFRLKSGNYEIDCRLLDAELVELAF